MQVFNGALSAFEEEAQASSMEYESSESIRCLPAMEAEATDFLWADACIFIVAENFAAIAGGMKNFFDRIFYPVSERQEQDKSQFAKPYQLLIDTGNDGQSCERQLHTILKGLSAKPVQETSFIYGKPTNQNLEQARDLGYAFYSALLMKVF